MNKKYMTVNGKKVAFTGKEKNLLTVIKGMGIEIPTFCYHSALSVYGACRMCIVEDEKGNIMASCSIKPQEGMSIKTHTKRLMNMRRMILELLLANDHQDCTICDKSGSCQLQTLAQNMGVKQVRFDPRKEREALDKSSPSIIRNPNKCILCGDCVRICSEVQGVGVLGFMNRGPKIEVSPAFNKPIADVDCINCGQCVSVCPTGALLVKDDTMKVWEAINDPEKLVVAQIAPAVRVAIGEEFGLKDSTNYLYKSVSALRLIGVDYVFDTSFTADMTIIEETHEFIDRVKQGKNLPHLTSCCPAWVTYVERNCPDLISNLSSCRSPQGMFGSLIKKYFAKQKGIDPKNIFVVSVMPCTAKKAEAIRPQLSTEKMQDIDTVITTVEFARMIRKMGIQFADLEPSSLDMPFGFSSGAGVLFGNSGGVAEATLRFAAEKLSKEPLKDVNFDDVRGLAGVKSAHVDINGTKVRVGVVSGLANMKEIISKIRENKSEFDIIEVMACAGGCIGGGGQPVPNNIEARKKRNKSIYSIDSQAPVKKSQENPTIKQIYTDWLGEPNSKVAHRALHTHYGSKKRIDGMEILDSKKTTEEKLTVSVCVGTNCYLKGSYDVLQKLISLSKEYQIEDKVEFKGTFCLENCACGPSIKLSISDHKFGLAHEDVEDFFKNNILCHFSN
ncbi:MAG: ferredoxin [Candidatus Cloacimonadota bacterium]|nr:MAG: ferredoxin [Candidatus Cloacimonadota bacterium]